MTKVDEIVKREKNGPLKGFGHSSLEFRICFEFRYSDFEFCNGGAPYEYGVGRN
mgnify:CR=1 FL=1